MALFKKGISFSSFAKTVIILVVFYALLGIFMTGGVGIKNGKPYVDIGFEFGKAFDPVAFFTILVMATIAWLLLNYVLDVRSISTRKQFFWMIAVGFLIFIGYIFFTGGSNIIPSFQDSVLTNTAQALIGP
jgi:magnesium-transporting ATPase (P-type)